MPFPVSSHTHTHTQTHIGTDQSLHTPNSVTHAPFNLPPPRSHTQTRTNFCSSALAVCTSSGRPESAVCNCCFCGIGQTGRLGIGDDTHPLLVDQVLFLQLPRVWLSTLNQTLGFSIQEPLQLQLAAPLLMTTGLTGPGLSINLKNGF